MKTRDIALIGVFSALSFGLMFLEFPLIPAANFLKYDPSEIPALILALNSSTLHGILTIIFKDVLFYFAKSGDPIGISMNALAGIFFIFLVKKFWRRKTVAGIISVTGTSALMTALNALVIPIYFIVMKWGNASDGFRFYLKVWWAILMFNIFKFGIDFLITIPLNKRMEGIFRLG